MPTPPSFTIGLDEFTADPYPTYARMRREAPVCHVPQLASVLIVRRDDVSACEKNVAVFSSVQPEGLMNRLMGLNLMRKDGADHQRERQALFPAVSPRTVAGHWSSLFTAHAERLIEQLLPEGAGDLHDQFALPFAAECLKSVTGLTNVNARDLDSWSQAMIAGIANYRGDALIEAACNAATAAIDDAIDDMLPVTRVVPDLSLLGVMLDAGLPEESIRANLKLAISGGQNEPRHAILGTLWALLTHPAQRAMLAAGTISCGQAFDEYVRWISPIGMSPRRIAQPHTCHGCDLEAGQRVFLMFGAANRDEAHFDRPDEYDATRDNSKSIPFGAGAHFCAGASISRTMIAGVALPALLKRMPALRLASAEPPRISGWAFRGLQHLPVAWR